MCSGWKTCVLAFSSNHWRCDGHEYGLQGTLLYLEFDGHTLSACLFLYLEIAGHCDSLFTLYDCKNYELGKFHCVVVMFPSVVVMFPNKAIHLGPSDPP